MNAEHSRQSPTGPAGMSLHREQKLPDNVASGAKRPARADPSSIRSRDAVYIDGRRYLCVDRLRFERDPANDVVELVGSASGIATPEFYSCQVQDLVELWKLGRLTIAPRDEGEEPAAIHPATPVAPTPSSAALAIAA